MNPILKALLNNVLTIENIPRYSNNCNDLHVVTKSPNNLKGERVLIVFYISAKRRFPKTNIKVAMRHINE